MRAHTLKNGCRWPACFFVSQVRPQVPSTSGLRAVIRRESRPGVWCSRHLIAAARGRTAKRPGGERTPAAGHGRAEPRGRTPARRETGGGHGTLASKRVSPDLALLSYFSYVGFSARAVKTT